LLLGTSTGDVVLAVSLTIASVLLTSDKLVCIIEDADAGELLFICLSTCDDDNTTVEDVVVAFVRASNSNDCSCTGTTK
jgi:hypothetical protein